MAQRTVALCNGKYIGIETIYTVINGQQINIPDKLKELRVKSRNNELFCPCGCGKNLILVAGDKNLREQHFREKNGTGECECTMPTEGRTSVDSKIVLKCWLDDKLQAADIESRVPVDTIEDTKRKPEFTFLSIVKKLGVRYWKTRANILDDRLDVLTGNMSGIRVIYIVDASNGGTDGQYPEALIKIQDKQQYCLLLTVHESDYDKAQLQAVFYETDLDGLWKEIVFAEGFLKDFDFSDDNRLVMSGQRIDQLLKNAKVKFSESQEIEKQRRIEEKRIRQENHKRWLEQEARHKEEIERQRQEKERRLQLQREETEKRRKEAEEKRRLEEEKAREEKRKREEDFKRNMESDFSQQETQVRDAEGRRWIKCEFCGKIALEDEFASYGGVNQINLGTCKECSDNNPAVKERMLSLAFPKKKYDPTVCPQCGGKLRERSGPYGSFYGCSNYPRCRYSRPIRR